MLLGVLVVAATRRATPMPQLVHADLRVDEKQSGVLTEPIDHGPDGNQ
jgi:hypothetical protein